jgi:hypothetical protein
MAWGFWEAICLTLIRGASFRWQSRYAEYRVAARRLIQTRVRVGRAVWHSGSISATPRIVGNSCSVSW